MATDGLIALPSPDPKDPGKDNTADGNFECLRSSGGSGRCRLPRYVMTTRIAAITPIGALHVTGVAEPGRYRKPSRAGVPGNATGGAADARTPFEPGVLISEPHV
jgi:hypothetical protein